MTLSARQSELLAAWKAEEIAPFSGWDFTRLADRVTEDPLPWSYEALARELLVHSPSVIDMGTGGGERFLEMRDLWPTLVTVTEEYPPNLALCRRRLEPLGVRVVEANLARVGQLPFVNEEFSLVLNRHSGFNPFEVSRILAPGGTFLTQQVHGLTLADLMAEFGVSPKWPEANPETYGADLRAAGLTLVTVREHWGPRRYLDVGALVFSLRAIPWLVDDFSVARFEEVLFRLQDRLESRGVLEFTDRHYLIEARKEI